VESITVVPARASAAIAARAGTPSPAAPPIQWTE
jgi:hypothetical protein